MNKPMELILVEKAVANHEYKDLHELHNYIDELVDSLMSGKGRPAQSIQSGYACRASV
jgi:hypothetical protein